MRNGFRNRKNENNYLDLSDIIGFIFDYSLSDFIISYYRELLNSKTRFLINHVIFPMIYFVGMPIILINILFPIGKDDE